MKMEFETTETTVRSTPSRHEKSLGLLTMKFVSLLQEAKDGVLDLKVVEEQAAITRPKKIDPENIKEQNSRFSICVTFKYLTQAADSLAVKQKRRIYDITNVLEGVGLIEKKNKNIIQWRGQNRSSQTQEVLEQVRDLKTQLSELEALEKELDEQKERLEENINRLNHDPGTSAYKFVTYEDVCGAFNGDTLLAVVAPSGTQLEVPLPEMCKSGQKKYQVNLRSHSAPIQVLLINRELGSTVPVVFSVPPIDNICPTPPSTPASLQRFPLLNSQCSESNTASLYCSQDSVCSDHQMVLPDHDVLTPSCSPEDVEMVCHVQPAAVLEQPHVDLMGSEFSSVLDVGSLLKLSVTGDHMKDERDGAVDIIDELMSANGMDYSFNLDDNEGVSDLFDVQILNY